MTLPQQPEANDVIGNTILDLGARGRQRGAVCAAGFARQHRYLVPSSAEKAIHRRAHARAPTPSACRPFTLSAAGHGKADSRGDSAGGPASVAQCGARPSLRRRNSASWASPHYAAKQSSGEFARRAGRDDFRCFRATAGWPEIVLDVAHNPAGAWALRSALSECYDNRPLIFVFGAMRDKAISEMTEILFPLADQVIATRPENPRSASPEEIQQAGSRDRNSD